MSHLSNKELVLIGTGVGFIVGAVCGLQNFNPKKTIKVITGALVGTMIMIRIKYPN